MSDETPTTVGAPPAAETVPSANGAPWVRDFHSWQRRSRQRLSRRRLVVLGLVGVLLLAAVAYAAYAWHYGRTHVSTDDAFIASHIAAISTRVAGTVAAVVVNDNQDLRAGDVLVRLDARDYEVALAQAQAAVETARGELLNATVSVPMTDQSTLSLLHEADASLAAIGHARQGSEHDLEQRRNDLGAKQAAVAASEAAVQAAQSDFDKAKADRDRTVELLRKELVAQQDFDHAEAAFRNAQGMLEVARQKLAQARADERQAAAAVRSSEAAVAQARERVAQSRATVANAQSQRQQVKVREAQVAAAQGRLQLALANLKQAQLNLDYTAIRAPITGRVTRKSVEVGQVVAPGQPLLSVVDMDDVWVVANFKETQLTDVRPGQRATIEVDTYPSTVFKGHVDSIQGGSGAVFSLLPPENATGNYVKVVQRIPVKIVLDRGENARHLLVPGMSVIPTITLR